MGAPIVRALRISLAAVAVLLVAIALLWTCSIDRWLAGAIEEYGSEALGTKVSVDAVRLETAEGRGTIRGLRVAQPEGFGSGDAIAVDEILLDLDAASLVSGEVIVIEHVRVVAPRVSYVVRKDRTSNLTALQANLERADSEPEPAPVGSEEQEMRLRILLLEIEQGQIDGDLSALGLGHANVPLSAVRHRNLGGPRGAPPGEIATAVGSQFVADVLAGIARSTIGRRLDQLFDEGSRGVKSLLDSLFPR